MSPNKIIIIAFKIFIGLSLLLLITFVGFYVFDKLNNKKSVVVPTNVLAPVYFYQAQNFNENFNESYVVANLLNKFRACQNNPENDFLKSNGNYYLAGLIVGMKAMINRDISLCDKFLINQEDKSICFDLYYVFMNDLENSDLSECDKIKDKDMAVFCKINFESNDSSACTSVVADYNKVYCNAITMGDENICANLTTEEKGQCEDNFFLAQALHEKNYASCDKIKISNRGAKLNKTYCKIILGPDAQKEWDRFYAINQCMFKYVVSIAKEKNDISFCEYIPQKDKGNKEMYQKCRIKY